MSAPYNEKLLTGDLASGLFHEKVHTFLLVVPSMEAFELGKAKRLRV